ncbi:MAG: LysE family translocator [Muribaculum sp.]|nr:LysE family translocator [Muribaculum sp.]
MLWRGIAIGLIISAPMGPVGILCIQRTLDKGRKAGFFTGVGAAISDLVYCLLTGFGLSFIEEFLQRNSAVIQLLGSVVLIAFSVYLFKKNPARDLHRPEAAEVSTKKSILAGFFFTFSNPLILFLTIGLFARFNFMMAEFKFYHYIVGYIAILAGALGWWWVVTFFIDKVRSHFNLRSMWLINKIIGAVVLLFAVVGIFTAVSALAEGSKAIGAPHTPRIIVNQSRGYESIGGDSLISPAEDVRLGIEAGLTDFDLRLCVKGNSSPWRLELSEDKDTGRVFFFDFRDEEFYDGVSSTPSLVIAADTATARHSDRSGQMDAAIPLAEPKRKTVLPYDGNLSHGYNLITLMRRGPKMILWIGHKGLKKVMEMEAMDFSADGLRLRAMGGKPLEVRSLDVARCPGVKEVEYMPGWSGMAEAKGYLRESLDATEGCWMLLDGTYEETLARKGGEYRLLTVADGNEAGGYLMIYLDGARVHAEEWQPGMVKGRMRPTGVKNVWDVSWTDAEGKTMHRNIRAQMEDGNTLSIYFPYQQTTLRFRRVAFDGI